MNSIAVCRFFSTPQHFINYLIFIDENQFLDMPYADNGNLRDYIKANTLSFNRKIEIATNIVNGIMFLHMEGLVHGNLVSNI